MTQYSKSHLIILVICVLWFTSGQQLCNYLPNQQYQALKSLYISSGGPYWNVGNEIAWYFPENVSTSVSPCSEPFAGVSCRCQSMQYSVTGLNLSQFSLFGSIPSEIGGLTDLLILDLSSNNGLFGNIPEAIGNLTNLQILDLSNNFLSYIPSSIGNLTALRVLNLGYNQLSGGVPNSLQYLVNLQVLQLNNNGYLLFNIGQSIINLRSLTILNLQYTSLTGTIPEALGDMNTLEYLNLEFNVLSGHIPPSIGNLTSLTILYLYSNRLSGTIPPTVGNLKSLEMFTFEINSLSGEIPETLWYLQNITELYLGENYFSGTISTEISNLKQLQCLDLDSNMFSGSIPPTIGELQNLSYFSISVNRLTGTIPSALTNMSSLVYFDISNNFISGTIPSHLGNLSRLYYFIVTQNMLSGSLPFTISSLVNIESLSVNQNRLTGSVPDSIFMLSVLNALYLDINYFSGTIPSSLGNIATLVDLDLGFNHLSKTIPPELFTPYLSGLALNSNILDGSIPSTIGISVHLFLLYLFDNQLTGSFPSSIVYLKNFQDLDAHANKLTGTIPSDLGNIINFIQINLGNNKLHGKLPNFKSTELLSLGLYDNSFTGTIPGDLLPIKSNSIQYLLLNSNRLSGTIPSIISYLTNLVSLNLTSNLLTGSIPDELSNIQSILGIYLSNNFLSHRIPPTLFVSSQNSSYLRSVYLNNNALTGPLPSSIGLASSLNYFWLNSNFLTGTIPTSVASMTQLVELLLNNNKFSGKFFGIFSLANSTQSEYKLANLNIADNLFSGEITWDFSMFSNLTSIVATSNCLEGSIPYSICSLRDRILTSVILDVSGGNTKCPQNIKANKNKPRLIRGLFSNLGLTGTLPNCLFSMPRLETIHLAGNQLIGTVPELIEINSLSSLVLSNNRLVGTIPLSIQRHAFLALDLSNNRLDGTLIDSFELSRNQTVIGLAVNRLSGPFPRSLKHEYTSYNNFTTYNVLASNVFECGGLPSNDPSSNSYSCGSYDLNIAYYTFASMLGLLILVIFTFDVSMRNHRSSVLMATLGETIVKWYKLSSNPPGLLNETKAFVITSKIIRNFAIVLVLLNTLVLIPVYLSYNITNTGTIVSYQFGNVVSMAYLHGIAIYIFIVTFLFLVISTARIMVAIVRVLFTDYFVIAQATIFHPPTVSYSVLVYAFLVFLHIINAVVTVCINAVYVNSIVNSTSPSEFLIFQILIGVFKVLWNSVYVPLATKRLEKFFSASSAMQSRYFMSIVNFVIAPCVATLAANQSCFYYIIKGVEPINVSTGEITTNCDEIFYSGVVPQRVCSVTNNDSQSISAYPPFHYSYSCGSALLTTYTPVLTYVYIFNGFILPFARLFLDSCGPEYFVNRMAGLLGFNLDQLKGRNILIDLLIHTTVMLTFGLASPVLGIEIGITIFINSFVSLILLGKILEVGQSVSTLQTNPMNGILSNALPPTYSSALLILEHVTLNNSWRSVIVCVDMVVLTVMTFWALVCFDIIADTYGWVNGLISSLMIGVILSGLIVGCGRWFSRVLSIMPNRGFEIIESARHMLLFDQLSMKRIDSHDITVPAANVFSTSEDKSIIEL